MTDPGLFEIIHSTRAMRRLKPDPVPREAIERILRAGQAAPSGGNAQNWGFIVVESPDIKRQVQHYYQRAYDEGVGRHYAERLGAMPAGEARDKLARQVAAVSHLTERFHEAPVWIVACLDVGPKGGMPGSGASIYPAVQNMLLAARALGLGATLTMRHMMFGAEVDAIFGLPEGIRSFAILPIGYPEGRFGPVQRGPLSEVTHHDRWGNSYF
ncbi:nitroreductase family protein [Iodidimonas sp. SYSU 1G8]|uniref:nitroreductase family protein n=1 Tax=Iodidimonas sp. SYSU 1G8 TaxID=3133967 RepID=UPI0031FF2ED5